MTLFPIRRFANLAAIVLSLHLAAHAATGAELFLHSLDGPGFDADFGYGDTTATIVGSPTIVSGQFGNAVAFGAGSTSTADADYLRFSGDNHLKGASGSVSFWFRPNFDSTSENQAFLFAMRGPSSGNADQTATVRMYYHDHSTRGPEFSVSFAHPDGNLLPAGLAASFDAGQWIQVGVTWSQVDATNTQFRISIDNVPKVLASAPTTRWFGDVGTEFFIGNREGGGGPGANGTIDNLRINDEWINFNFASVPEPSSLGMVVISGAVCWMRRIGGRR